MKTVIKYELTISKAMRSALSYVFSGSYRQKEYQ